MYIHLGRDTVARSQEVVGIFDIDNCSTGKRTRNFLAAAQKGGRVIDVTEDLPKSFIVMRDEKVFISAISAATLKKRCAAD